MFIIFRIIDKKVFIHILKQEVDELSIKLNKYDAGKVNVALLLGFEENNTKFG